MYNSGNDNDTELIITNFRRSIENHILFSPYTLIEIILSKTKNDPKLTEQVCRLVESRADDIPQSELELEKWVNDLGIPKKNLNDQPHSTEIENPLPPINPNRLSIGRIIAYLGLLCLVIGTILWRKNDQIPPRPPDNPRPELCQENRSDLLTHINELEYLKMQQPEDFSTECEEKLYYQIYSYALDRGRNDLVVPYGLDALCKIPSDAKIFPAAKSKLEDWLQSASWGESVTEQLTNSQNPRTCPAYNELNSRED